MRIVRNITLTLSTFAAVLLTGCGAAETAAVTAAQAEAAIEQAKEGERIKAKVEQDLAAAQQAAASQRKAVDQE
jgi:hypothetical protein